MTIVMGIDQHRAQITGEWIDTTTGEMLARAGGAGGPRRVCGSSFAVRRRGAGGRAGGDDRLAVRGRGAASGSVRRCIWPSRRRPAALRGQEEAREDRPGRRAASARAADDRAAAGVVDPAGAHPRSRAPGCGCGTRSRSSAASGSSGSRRCSITTAARSARDLLTARRARVARRAAAARRRARAGHDRAGDDRRARRPDRAVRRGAARVCAPPAGLPGADRAHLRDRAS